MQILVEAQVFQSRRVNKLCWEDVDLEQGIVATRGFLIHRSSEEAGMFGSAREISVPSSRGHG